MARPKKPDRFVCIEDRGGEGARRFRVHFVRGGRRLVHVFGTEEEAKDCKERIKKATAHLQTGTVGKVVERYFEEMVGQGKWRESAAAFPRKKWLLRTFLEPVEELAIGAVTAEHVTRCCKAWDSPKRGAAWTRRLGRVRAKAFFRWAVAANILRSSPMDEKHMVPVPRQQLGRLRLDDARLLRGVIDPAAQAGDASATFVLAGLLLGARTSELVSFTAKSLDDGGRVVTYADAKDPARLHVVRLPEALRGPLHLLAEAAGGGHLFTGAVGWRASEWGARAVRRWAAEAGLEMAAEMDVRWLRRTKDSLAVEAGVSSEVVARETGHSLHVARKHYIQHGAETTGRASAMEEATAPVRPIARSSGTSRRKASK